MDEETLAEQIAQRVAQVVLQPESPPSPEDIADAMMRRLSPVLTPLIESPMATQTAIDAAVIERLDRLSSPSDIAEQTAEKIFTSIQEQAGHSEDASAQLRRDFNNLAQQVTDALENLQAHSQDSQFESVESLRQDIQALAQQLTGAIENFQGQHPGSQPRPAVAKPSRAAESASKYEPSSIEDNWKAVAHHLNRTRGNREASLGGLLRGARPVDIWLDPKDEKLMLPFRSPIVLSKIQEELSHPEVRRIIAESVARHFGKPLEIEPVLLNQSV